MHGLWCLIVIYTILTYTFKKDVNYSSLRITKYRQFYVQTSKFHENNATIQIWFCNQQIFKIVVRIVPFVFDVVLKSLLTQNQNDESAVHEGVSFVYNQESRFAIARTKASIHLESTHIYTNSCTANVQNGDKQIATITLNHSYRKMLLPFHVT